MKIHQRSLALWGLTALLTVAMAGCSPSAPAPQGQGQNPNPEPPPAQGPSQGPGQGQGQGQGTGRRTAAIVVQVETAHDGDLAVDNTAAGTVTADTQSSVAAGSTGTVQTLVRQAGDWVEAGAPVIKLDDSQLQLSLRIAQANLRNARIAAGLDQDGKASAASKVALQLDSAQKSYNSALALSKIGGIAAADLDTAQANLEAAKINVEQASIAAETAALQVQQAQLNLQYSVIKAPYAGQISSINVQPGVYVAPSTVAFVLVSKKKRINFGVAPGDTAGLVIGKPVRFAYGGRVYPTVVTQAPSAPVNGLVTLTAALPPEVPASLGTVGTVAYSVVLAHGTIVSLPTLQSTENKTFVLTVNNNRVARVDVTILAESGSMAAVSGLAPGSVVIDNPPPGLLVGAQVQTVEAPGAAPATGAKAAPQEGAPHNAQPEAGKTWGSGNGTGKRRSGQQGVAPAQVTGGQ